MPVASSARRRERQWLNRTEAAGYVGLSTGRLANLASRGEGPPVHRSGTGTVRYDVSELDEWLAGEGRK